MINAGIVQSQSERRGETQKERLSREMDVSLRISLHCRKFDHSEETSFPSFAIWKGVVNDTDDSAKRRNRSFSLPRFSAVIDVVMDGFEVNFTGGGGNCCSDRQVSLFFLSLFSWNLVIYRHEFDSFVWMIGRKFGIDGSRVREMFINLLYTCMTLILFL